MRSQSSASKTLVVDMPGEYFFREKILMSTRVLITDDLWNPRVSKVIEAAIMEI